jgi:hypothetical protein
MAVRSTAIGSGRLLGIFSSRVRISESRLTVLDNGFGMLTELSIRNL